MRFSIQPDVEVSSVRRLSVPVLSPALLLAGLILTSSFPSFASSTHVRAVGAIASLEPATDTLTVAPSHGANIALKIGATTEITLDNAPASLLDLAEGMNIVAVYNPTTLTALTLRVQTAQQLAVADGKVTAISATSLTVAIGDRRSLALSAAPTLNVVLDGADSSLINIKVGDEARAFFDQRTRTVFIVDARTPAPQPAGVTGSISQLGAADLTVTPDHGTAVALTTDSTTQVFLNGAPSTLSALAVGDHARVIYVRSTLVAQTIHAQSPQERVDSVDGHVTAVGSSTITITPEHGSAVDLTTASTTQIFLDGKVAALSSISVGDEAHATYDAATMVAALLAVASPSIEPVVVEGTVTADSSTSVTITPHSGSAVSLTADSSTKIFVNSHSAAIGAVAVGDSAQAIYDPTTLAAIVIDARTPAQHLANVEGAVTADSPSSITITPRTGTPITLTADANTRLSLNGSVVTLGAIPVGDAAEAVYDSSTLVAEFIEAHTPVEDLTTVEGAVNASSATSITVTPASGSPVVLTSDASTKVVLDGRPSTLVAIEVGDQARAVYDRTTMVATLVTASSGEQFTDIDGKVTADSASSITISGDNNHSKTLTADSATIVVLNGATSTLSAIPIGAEAHARYNSATLVATNVEAQSPRHQLSEIEGSAGAITASSITVTPSSGAAVTLTVVNATQIFLDGRVATLSAIVPGDEVRVTYDSGTMDAVVILARSESDGGH
jgi:hypothetical protein